MTMVVKTKKVESRTRFVFKDLLAADNSAMVLFFSLSSMVMKVSFKTSFVFLGVASSTMLFSFEVL